MTWNNVHVLLRDMFRSSMSPTSSDKAMVVLTKDAATPSCETCRVKVRVYYSKSNSRYIFMQFFWHIFLVRFDTSLPF